MRRGRRTVQQAEFAYATSAPKDHETCHASRRIAESSARAKRLETKLYSRVSEGAALGYYHKLTSICQTDDRRTDAMRPRRGTLGCCHGHRRFLLHTPASGRAHPGRGHRLGGGGESLWASQPGRNR